MGRNRGFQWSNNLLKKGIRPVNGRVQGEVQVQVHLMLILNHTAVLKMFIKDEVKKCDCQAVGHVSNEDATKF